MAPISYWQECKRKLFHLSSIWMAFAMHFMERSSSIPLFAALTLIVVMLESARHRHPVLMKSFNFLFGGMLREHKRNHTFSGAVYVLLAAALSVILFPKSVAVTAFTIMIISDTFSALVGRRWGKHSMPGGKSVEGTAAFIVTGIVVVFACSYIYVGSSTFLLAGIAGVIGGAVIELFSKQLGLDDNLTITLAAGCIMYGILYIV